MKKTIAMLLFLMTCSLSTGCSQTANVETGSASITVPSSESAEASKENPSADTEEVSANSSEPQAEEPINAAVSEKEEIINNLKKQAEDEAETDRHFIIGALDEGADGRWGEACGFIQNQYPEYFSSDELLQKSIKYGHYLVSVSKDSKEIDKSRGFYYEMGLLVSETAQDIYMGSVDLSDRSVSEKLQKLEEKLISYFGQHYGFEHKHEADQTDTQVNSAEFSAKDVYVVGNPILSSGLFLNVNIDDIKNIESDLSRYDGEEHESGQYIYWEGEGITYVSHSTMNGNLYAIILTTDQFQLNCGLQLGMKEEEIASLAIPFVSYKREDYPMDSLFLADDRCPLNTVDYDTIYLYQFGGIPEDVSQENAVIKGGRISITALVKDGVIVSVFTNIPVAG